MHHRRLDHWSLVDHKVSRGLTWLIRPNLPFCLYTNVMHGAIEADGRWKAVRRFLMNIYEFRKIEQTTDALIGFAPLPFGASFSVWCWDDGESRKRNESRGRPGAGESGMHRISADIFTREIEFIYEDGNRRRGCIYILKTAFRQKIRRFVI